MSGPGGVIGAWVRLGADSGYVPWRPRRVGDFDETVSFDECTLCRPNDGLKAAVGSVLFLKL